MTLEEDEIFMCLAALLCKQFCRFANEGAKISIKSYFMRSFFSQCIQQQWSVSQNYFMIRSKLPTTARWSREKKERKLWSQLALCRKRLRHHRQIIHSVLRPLIVESKSQPVELDNSTIGLHLPSRRKNSLQSYCSMDFLALTRLDMTFDVTLRDDSSFGKLANSCNFKKRLIFTFTGNA